MRGAMKKQIVLAIVLALGASTLALATTQEEEQACTNDAFQFCQNFIPDRNRVFSCLVSNKDAISVACHSALLPYLPPEPVAAKKPLLPPPHAGEKTASGDKTAKTKGPLNLTPH